MKKMKEYKVFLASSSELAEERDQIALMIRGLNDAWVEKDIYMKLVLWERLLHSFQGNRIQDYFNEKMLECDIVIVLFFKKAGQFTVEEFRKAYQNLKQGKKPHFLYVYFKKGSVDIDDIDKDMLKIKDLKDEIKGYEEIYGSFDSIADLTLKLQHQLELVVKEETEDEDEEEEEEAEQDDLEELKSGYCNVLKKELGQLELLGVPNIDTQVVKLEDAFVSLRISESWRCEERFDPKKKPEELVRERYLSPEQVMTRAFKQYQLLVIIGDPGSGKTTLLKYYAVKCLDKANKKYKEFGFEQDVLPIYFPLREVGFDENGRPVLLPNNLETWIKDHLLGITAHHFSEWLKKENTLVLLDGLDEISSKKQRRKVCRWIEKMCTGLDKARFVVTSRATGFRKPDGIDFGLPHLRADIMDFSPRQQEVFLRKWFRAAFLSGLPPVDNELPEPEWREQQQKLADLRSKTIIDFLNREDNKRVRELAAVPMLLQIMAIIWKKRQYLPRTRIDLYDMSLNYMLEYRGQHKGIDTMLTAKESRLVLAPTALWMQEELEKDDAPKEEMHRRMQPILDTLAGQPAALAFCRYLRDRAGVIADYDIEHYGFRHKSFREYLSGIQLKEESHEEKRLKMLVANFKKDWWEETLRFFMSNSNDKIFDRFMRLFFQSPVSEELSAPEQNLLQNLVIDAPQRRIDALAECLNSDGLNNNQKRYVMECLKTINTPEALEAIEKSDKSKMDETTRSYAEDITSEASIKKEKDFLIEIPRKKDLEKLHSFRNPFEDNVEYIQIPGGTYKYSDTGNMETVPDLYFCKYPVTNKRYRRFISFLEGREAELLKMLPLEMFAEKLWEFAKTIERFADYMGKDPGGWPGKFRSYRDDDKKFNGDDQPVVSVSWYGARAYCFWLSCLESVLRKTEDKELFRLPTEIEWEWAAGGESNGSMREYPWPKDKDEPNPNLANYNGNVGATTPVRRYPEGATPAGLMDMAGNVWEWMENYADKDEDVFALRGGSWINDFSNLRCSARVYDDPGVRGGLIGFRVLRAQS